MDTPGDEELERRAMRLLALSTQARNQLSKQEVVYYGKAPNTAGLLFINYANMILNGNRDLYDDALFLLESNRYSSACIIARCVMETHAVGIHAWDEVEKALKKDGRQGAGKKIIRFINDSKFKMEEQKALKGGKFELGKYHFTRKHKLGCFKKQPSQCTFSTQCDFCSSLNCNSRVTKKVVMS